MAIREALSIIRAARCDGAGHRRSGTVAGENRAATCTRTVGGADSVSLRLPPRGNYRQCLYRLKRLQSTGLVAAATFADRTKVFMPR
ncbi:MAG: hypothetical protein H7327_15890 [Herminiimonas sp.]|nr:hypothetical protein [Herminiimonas sp.]